MTAKRYESTIMAHARYQKDKTKMKGVRFFPDDMELLEHAESTGNFSGYIKNLIRADMEKAHQK
jgi:hypothetical protein